MTEPEVSIICTIRDGAAVVDRMINSVLNQTFESFELLIVDDGSEDDTWDRVRVRQMLDDRITLLPGSARGRGAALHQALTATRAALVANIDADDEWHPDFLRYMTASIQQHADYDLITCQPVIVIDMPPGESAVAQAEKWEDTVPPLRDVTAGLGRHNPICHSGCLFRRNKAGMVGGYDALRSSQLDYDLWVRMAVAGSRLAVLPMRLAFKHRHAQQAFERKNHLAYVLGSVRIQARAISAMRLPLWFYLYLPLRLAWAVLPFGLRSWGRRILGR